MTKEYTPYIIPISSGGAVLVAPIMQYADLLSISHSDDVDYVASMSQKRQCEQLMWRMIVRNFFVGQCVILSYDSVGAPQISLPDSASNFFIGVSHSSSHVAVIISQNSRCSIDIEQLSRDFTRVESRYISLSEQPLIRAPHDRALLWSIKEALYKFAGRRELNLLDDIRVTQLSDGHFSGSIAPHDKIVEGSASTLFGHSLVYIIAQ